MKRWGASLVLVLIIALFPRLATAQSAQNFIIQSFEADYTLSRTDRGVSTMHVVERIVAEFPSSNQNHGILRAIPKDYKDNTLGIDVKSVTNERGTPYKYTDYSERGNLVLRIGDADTYVHGVKTYVITYDLKNVVAFHDDYDELYWDVNGDQWPQAMSSVTARLHLPSEIADGMLDRQPLCFAGGFGQNDAACEISQSKQGDQTVITASAQDLGGYQTLTFVVGFQKNVFQPDRLAAMWKAILLGLIVASVVLPPLVTLIVVWRKWRRAGRDAKGRGVIVPQYQPPKNSTVVIADVVLNERMTNKAITAAVIGLAVRGYIVISESTEKKLLKDKTEFSLQLVKDPVSLAKDELEVIRIFFGPAAAVGDEVKISSLKNSIYRQVAALGRTASRLATDQGFFVVDPVKARRFFMVPAVLLLVIGFVLSFTVVLIPVGIGLVLSGVILLIANTAMPARTAEGVALKEYLLGLRDYIGLAEKDRLAFLQSVKGAERIMKDEKSKIKLFEQLLPFAMLFGLEKSWAAEFQDIYSQPPDWYNGNWRTFNTAYLASSLTNFSSASAASFSPPSSSGSSGFSSGGGFSGGGGGGGGGGGW